MLLREEPPTRARRAETLSLLIAGPGPSTVFVLPACGEIVVGRGGDCAVQLDDPKLSRKHATLFVEGDNVTYLDHGSLNGSYVREARVQPHTPTRVGPGDSITVGDTVIVLRRGDGPAASFHVWTHGHFESVLADACDQAVRGGRPFALLRLRFSASEENAATREKSEPPILAAWLGPEDVVGRYAPHDYEVLLARATESEADVRSRELSIALRQTGARFDLGVAAFPKDGRTPEALMEHASHKLHREITEPTGVVPTTVTSGALERMGRVVARVAAGSINVLILGETGAGKDVLARRIHELSPRARQPLVSINCAALTESLLESELFGHEKGAFTGAATAKDGLLESANGGTVFLDEIGEMPPATQAKLLRVLEQREVMRVGAVRPRPIDVRFVCATNRDVESDVAAGKFRADLFFRLNGVSFTLPPLRERIDEIAPLANAFIAQACRTVKRASVPRLEGEALALLERYAWPGNIRELRNVMERAVLLSSGDVVLPAHLPLDKLQPAPPRAASVVPTSLDPLTPVHGPSEDERARIVRALERCAWNQSQAARVLGVSRGTLIKRLDELKLPRPRKR